MPFQGERGTWACGAWGAVWTKVWTKAIDQTGLRTEVRALGVLDRLQPIGGEVLQLLHGPVWPAHFEIDGRGARKSEVSLGRTRGLVAAAAEDPARLLRARRGQREL